jgi:hypothetical protein
MGARSGLSNAGAESRYRTQRIIYFKMLSLRRCWATWDSARMRNATNFDPRLTDSSIP